jgi:hypothetical protein
MASPQWGERDEAQKALRAIVSDPVYGVSALSSAQIMANLLKDLLPDAPREVSILVAAAEAGVASSLRDRVSQGMDVGTASAVVAGSFAASTPFRPEACNWAVSEIAGALGLSSPASSPDPGPGIPLGSSVPGGAQPTISAPLPAADPGSAPGGYPSSAGAGSYPATAAGPGGYPAGVVPGAYPPAAAPGGYPPAAAPGGYPAAATPGGLPSAGQARPPDPYPSAPPPPGNARGGYQAVGGYQSPPVPGYWSQPPASGYASVTRTNGLAIASLVLGVLWLFWLGSVLALVFGLVALKQIRTRDQGGRGIAIAGVVLGILGLVVLAMALIVGASTGSSGS